MKNIGFYIENLGSENVDCSNIELGNPGLGGTKYLFILVSHLLSKRENNLNVISYVQVKGLLPDSLNVKITSTFKEAIRAASEDNCDYLVYWYHPGGNIYTTTDFPNNSNLRLIPWCHNFCTFKDLDKFAKDDKIAHIITVGREQLDLYRDHPAYEKSSYIYNGVNFSILDKYKIIPFAERKNIVTYIGSIVPMKSFHRLAQAWPRVLKAVPDAQLYVIGSGKLYSRDNKLGKYEIAEATYEDFFIKYLEQNGHIIPSVHFMGLMGEEKFELLNKTKVGVPNPLGTGETFCLSAVEMQIMGARLTAKRSPGYMDTFKNAIFCENVTQLADNIIFLLKSNQSDYNKAIKYLKENFDISKIIIRWEELLRNGTLEKDQEMSNSKYKHKYLKDFLRRKKKLYPYLTHLPSLEYLDSTYNRYLYRIMQEIGLNKYDRFDQIKG